jgi:hypothetical protein
MKQNKIFLLLVVLLAVLNIGLVYLHFFSGRHKHARGDDAMHSWLDRNLHMTDQQESLHVGMRKKYFDELRVINDTLKHLKARFVYLSSEQELTDSLADLWTDSINRWNRRADELTFRHVRKVRAMLEPNQKPILDSLIQIVMLGKRRD